MSFHNRTKISILVAIVILIGAGGYVVFGDSEDLSGSTDTVAVRTPESTTVETSTTTASTTSDDSDMKSYESHEEEADYEWEEAEEVMVVFSDQGNTSTDDTVVIGEDVTIQFPGTYRLSGVLSDGQLVVDVAEKGVVRLILDNVSVINSNGPALYIHDADKVVVILADDSKNYLADGSNYDELSGETDQPNAALYSTTDLTLAGNGSLEVVGQSNDAIASKDGLVFAGNGVYDLQSIDDSVRGKDYVVISGGTFSIEAGGDGIKSDNTESDLAGYVEIAHGSFEIVSDGDAIEGAGNVQVAAGDFNLTTGADVRTYSVNDDSVKGIKAGLNLEIVQGTFEIVSFDDALHANGSLSIAGGDFILATSDDAIHADASVTIFGGDIEITESYEGIESGEGDLNIAGGSIQINASDDGLNIAGGGDGSGFMGPGGRGGGTQAAAGNYSLNITGGEIMVNTAGDGFDINGSVTMTGGLLVINGPTSSADGTLDYDGAFTISGGVLMGTGSAGMAMAPSSSSPQNSVLINLSTTASAGTKVAVFDQSGRELYSLTPSKPYQSIVFSSDDLQTGSSYTIYLAGEEYDSFAVSSSVTTVGTAARMGGRPF